jgi:tetratricopeptide (TPR) repeat protein
VLTGLLPGLREIRAPVISGYLWLVFFFLAFHGALPSRQSADPTLKPLFDLGHDLSALGIATVTGVAAYLVGSAAQELLKLVATIPPGPPLYAEAGTHLSAAGRDDVGSAVRFRVQAIQRRLYQVALSPGEKGVDGEPSPEMVESDLPLIRTLLLGDYPDLVAELDRLQAEADLRITVAVPIAALAILFCFAVSPLWLLALLLAVGLLAQGYKRQVEVGNLLAKALRIGKVDAPTLQSLDASAAAAIERTELEEDLARKVKDGGSGMAAFRLGNLQASGGDSEGAVASLRIAIENNVIRAYAEIGFVYEALELFDEAEQAYRDGKKRKDRRATERLATLLRQQHREEEALQAEKRTEEPGQPVPEPPPPVEDQAEVRRISDYEARIQAGDAKAAINLGLLRKRRSEMDAAVAAFEKATSLNDEDAQAWLSLGRALRWAGRAPGAVEALERARALLELDLGREHLEVADAVSDLGAAMSEVGDYENALPLLEKALRIQEAELGPDAIEVAMTLEFISNVVSGLGDEGRSRELDERALRLCENTLGSEDPRVAMSLRNLAVTVRRTGDFLEAKDMLERGLRIQETHPERALRERAFVLDTLGTVWDTVGEYATGLALHQQALEMVEEDLDSQHPWMAGLQVAGAASLRGLGRYSQALAVLAEAIPVLEESFGPKHPSLVTGLLAYAMALLDNERVNDSVAVSEYALDITTPAHRHLAFECLSDHAAALCKRDEFEKASSHLDRALALGAELFGAAHLYLAPVYVRLGEANAGANELAESVEMYQRGLAIIHSAPLLHRPLAGIASQGLAATLLRFSQFDAAEAAARDSISMLESVFGKVHPQISTTLELLASILDARADPAQASAARARAASIRSEPENEQGAGGGPALDDDQ